MRACSSRPHPIQALHKRNQGPTSRLSGTCRLPTMPRRNSERRSPESGQAHNRVRRFRKCRGCSRDRARKRRHSHRPHTASPGTSLCSILPGSKPGLPCSTRLRKHTAPCSDRLRPARMRLPRHIPRRTHHSHPGRTRRRRISEHRRTGRPHRHLGHQGKSHIAPRSHRLRTASPRSCSRSCSRRPRNISCPARTVSCPRPPTKSPAKSRVGTSGMIPEDSLCRTERSNPGLRRRKAGRS